MNILISGSNGFLGNAIFHHLKRNKKFNVFSINRRFGDFLYNFSDKDFICPTLNVKFDLLINCAFDYSDRVYKINNVNILITQNLIRLCKKNNITKFLNISSIDSSNGTDYGFLKKQIEIEVAKFSGGYTIRLGLVFIGNKNKLISKIQYMNRLIPFLQFSLGGKVIPIYISSFDNILKTIISYINGKLHEKIFIVTDKHFYDFNKLIAVDKPSLYFKIPIIFLIFFLKIYEFLNLPKISFNYDSLRNILKFNKNMKKN